MPKHVASFILLCMFYTTVFFKRLKEYGLKDATERSVQGIKGTSDSVNNDRTGINT